eukprot:8773541-Karenia_brevis.AAC.1
MSRTVAAICSDFERARADPAHLSVVIAGDFNFRLPTDKYLKLDGLHHRASMPEQIKIPSAFLALHNILSKFVLLHMDKPTHYDHANNKETSIDRIYCSIPKWTLRLLSINGRLHGNPYDNWKKG